MSEPALSTPWTEIPALVATYDTTCVGRRDHSLYTALATETGADVVVDVGCGTGVLAVDLARRGHRVIGVDPSGAMLEVARRRGGGDLVRWVLGTLADVPDGVADLQVMTGHVAQYLLSDEDWAGTLADARRVAAPGGRLAFESRDPRVDWSRRWTPELTHRVHPHPGGGTFTAWSEVVAATGPPDAPTLTHRDHWEVDGERLVTDETLRFRGLEEIVTSVAAAGLVVEHVWGTWDREPVGPGTEELVVVARAPA